MDRLLERGLACLTVLDISSALKPLGHAVIATFAADGPLTCSGLSVVRYSPDSLSAALGPDFSLVHAEAQDHITPGGAVQRFTFAVFQLTEVR